MSNDHCGAHGEAIACHFLQIHGLGFRERNWRHGNVGEIDLIMDHDDVVVFVEVKTRRSGGVEEAVTARKLHRLRRVAMAWLHSNPQWHEYRIDIVTVDINQGSASIDWLQGVEW